MCVSVKAFESYIIIYVDTCLYINKSVTCKKKKYTTNTKIDR